MTKAQDWHFDDFTESHYQYLLELAKNTWKFISFTEYKSEGRNILWRHDIDYSVQRAYKLAIIEASKKVKATYFIHLHNDFYNALEKEIAFLIHKIIDLGHDIGLHFDLGFYHKNTENIESSMMMEKNILENFFHTKIKVFSFHNPDMCNWLDIHKEEYAGMTNTYSNYFMDNYGFCSDSNGYWRFRRLKDVLILAEDKKLQILTHPGWWTPDVMSPRERITRCIEGRAARQHKKYDELLKLSGRRNIGKQI